MLNSFLCRNQNPSEGVACRRQPQSGSLYKPLCSVVRCSEYHTAHFHRSEKNRKILLKLFLWLDFSSSSNTEIVCKYHPKRIQAKGAKSSSPKVSFSRPHATSHTSSIDPCAKVPRRPDRRHFVNSPHSLSPKRSASGTLKRSGDCQKALWPDKSSCSNFFICPTHELHRPSEAMFTVLTIVVSDEARCKPGKTSYKNITVYDW